MVTVAIGDVSPQTGKPFDIVSHALPPPMLAEQCDLAVGEFIWTGGDCHLYENHPEQAREQLTRTPGALPRLEIARRRDAIDGYALKDFVLHEHVAQPPIKVAVAI